MRYFPLSRRGKCESSLRNHLGLSFRARSGPELNMERSRSIQRIIDNQSFVWLTVVATGIDMQGRASPIHDHADRASALSRSGGAKGR